MTAYRVRTKAHWLTFKLEHLAPVEAGAKTCTVRFSKSAARVRVGDRLVLAFGRYDRPTVLTATAARVEVVELEPDISRAYTLPESVLTLVEERRFYERPPLPDEATPAALHEALEASGGDYAALLSEAVDRSAERCTCIWWRDVRRA